MGTQIAILGRVVRPGMRFEHARSFVLFADGSFRPDTCTVTSVRRGVVQYQKQSGDVAASYPSSFVSVVSRWLADAA
jgi:hypothetical protein